MDAHEITWNPNLVNFGIPCFIDFLSENPQRALFSSSFRPQCRLGLMLPYLSDEMDAHLKLFLHKHLLAYKYHIHKYIWLVVSTHLKNISQNGNLPQIGVKIKTIWNHLSDICMNYTCPCLLPTFWRVVHILQLQPYRPGWMNLGTDWKFEILRYLT